MGLWWPQGGGSAERKWALQLRGTLYLVFQHLESARPCRELGLKETWGWRPPADDAG